MDQAKPVLDTVQLGSHRVVRGSDLRCMEGAPELYLLPRAQLGRSGHEPTVDVHRCLSSGAVHPDLGVHRFHPRPRGDHCRRLRSGQPRSGPFPGRTYDGLRSRDWGLWPTRTILDQRDGVVHRHRFRVAAARYRSQNTDRRGSTAALDGTSRYRVRASGPVALGHSIRSPRVARR